MAINTKISFHRWSHPHKQWNRISSLPLLLVKLSKCFAWYTISFLLKDTLPLYGNPIILGLYQLNSSTNSHYYWLSPFWTVTISCFEVVRIERIELLCKDFEAARPQLMWTLSAALTWEINAENRSEDDCYYYYYHYHCCFCCCFWWWYLLLGLLVLRTSLSSLYKVRWSVIVKSLFYCKVWCYYKVR